MIKFSDNKAKPQDFSVISGDDALTLPMINMGASRVISVIGQSFPKEFSQMVDLALNKGACISIKNTLRFI